MREINIIVIHHSGNHNTKEKIRQLHVEEYGWDDIGCHYMISKEGEILEGRPLHQIGAHVKGYNQCSIGIDFLGNFDIEEPTEIQLQAMIILVKSLIKEFNIKEVKGHREFPNVTKSCPGKNFDMDKFRQLL